MKEKTNFIYEAMTQQEAWAVVRVVRERLGARKFKTAIRQAWMTGDYESEGLSDLSQQLQIVRNNFGPSWLCDWKP